MHTENLEVAVVRHTQWIQKSASFPTLLVGLLSISLFLYSMLYTVYCVAGSNCWNSQNEKQRRIQVNLETKWINLFHVFPSHYKCCPHCMTGVNPLKYVYVAPARHPNECACLIRRNNKKQQNKPNTETQEAEGHEISRFATLFFVRFYSSSKSIDIFL